MLRFLFRRLLIAVPTVVVISVLVFALLELAPGDPTSQVPLTVPAEVREAIRESLGVNDPFFQKWTNWAQLMMINEPIHAFEDVTGACFGDCEERARIISWSSRSAAMDTVYQRIPQTLWVLGLGLLFGFMLAVPVGTLQAYKQYSMFDNLGTVFTLLGYSVPVFVIGPLLIWLFSVKLGWLPTFYDTTHDIMWTSWSTIWTQIKQLLMPVTVLTLFNAASFGRFTRGSVLENLNESYVRTARAKGLGEFPVVSRHVLRNSMIPVVTLLALQIPGIFAGAIITENVFRINGLGQLLLISIRQSDIPMVQTLVFIFAVLVVVFNILADSLYGILDPRIRYD
ncbi:MAG: peptide/nickel transport system permease protein [Verrucomicrobiales bacterium]